MYSKINLLVQCLWLPRFLFAYGGEKRALLDWLWRLVKLLIHPLLIKPLLFCFEPVCLVPPDNNFLLEWKTLVLFMALECQLCMYFWNSVQACRYRYIWMQFFMAAYHRKWNWALPSVWYEWYRWFGTCINENYIENVYKKETFSIPTLLVGSVRQEYWGNRSEGLTHS